MKIYKFISPYEETLNGFYFKFQCGEVIIDSMAHTSLLIGGSSVKKTIYAHGMRENADTGPYHLVRRLLSSGIIIPLEPAEEAKIKPHLTKRVLCYPYIPTKERWALIKEKDFNKHNSKI